MSERVKVYEENRKGLPLWAWLLPLLLILALLAYFLTRHHEEPAAATAPASQTAPAMPDLGTIHFDTDQASLTQDGQATLQRAAEAMKANPNIHLRLEGYTDSTGSTPHNDNLADRRAQTVASFLKGQGIDGSRLTGEGFGPAKPVNTNATEAGKADNRRVELFMQQ